MEEVKEYLVHSSIRVTSDRYGHLFPQARQERADSLERLFHLATQWAASLPRPLLRCGHDAGTSIPTNDSR